MASKAHYDNSCKVCEAKISRTAVICDACRKFYQRHCEKNGDMACSSGSGNCIVSGTNRTSCIKCRLEKCRIARDSHNLSGVSSKSHHNPSSAQPSSTGTASNSPETSSLCEDSTFSIHPVSTAPSRQHSGGSTNSSSAKTPSPTPPLSCNNNSYTDPWPMTSTSTVAIVPQPIIYDETNVEHTLHTVAQAYEDLSRLYNLPQCQSNDFIADRDLFMQLTFQHISSMIEIITSYSETIGVCENLCETEKTLLFGNGLVGNILATFYLLPASNGGSCNQSVTWSTHFFGVQNLKSLLYYYPQFEDCCKIYMELQQILHSVFANSSFIENAIILALIFFDENVLGLSRASRTRRRLWLALDLINAYSSAQRQESMWQCGEGNSRIVIDECLERVKRFVDTCRQVTLSIAACDPQVSEIVSMALQPSTFGGKASVSHEIVI